MKDDKHTPVSRFRLLQLDAGGNFATLLWVDGGKKDDGTKREREQHVSMFHQSLAAPWCLFFSFSSKSTSLTGGIYLEWYKTKTKQNGRK